MAGAQSVVEGGFVHNGAAANIHQYCPGREQGQGRLYGVVLALRWARCLGAAIRGRKFSIARVYGAQATSEYNALSLQSSVLDEYHCFHKNGVLTWPTIPSGAVGGSTVNHS